MSELVGVLLAAGLGTRFEDGNKLLAPVCQRDEPIVVRAARSFPDAVDHVVAVVGHEADAVREAVSSVVDETVHNPAYERGQSTSVRTGAIAARERDADAAVFLPGDMPTVDPRTVQRIVEASREDDVDAVVPVYDGRRGNPVLFDASCFDDLADLSGDTGGRALFETVAVRRLPVEDPGIHVDVDTVDDLASLECE
ncbi:nucleotidyltransferase family protein [Natrialba swarupiae]|uniref:Nucleotidyltransferase family protein n=1 Tax=Natrialba swarupiae TaxID=2448032 RepID=A0A5D5AUI3_9EURY|nr:nucleotidyltransferase family protein [Natrialba swarupiae]TYT62721.1 nucleotidyltransferase family protein [Natrialba swarupiae]